jgi:hypothetical protein
MGRGYLLATGSYSSEEVGLVLQLPGLRRGCFRERDYSFVDVGFKLAGESYGRSLPTAGTGPMVLGFAPPRYSHLFACVRTGLVYSHMIVSRRSGKLRRIMFLEPVE